MEHHKARKNKKIRNIFFNAQSAVLYYLIVLERTDKAE